MCKACTEGVHCMPPFHPPTPRCVDGLMLYIKVSEKSKIGLKHHGHLRSVLQLPRIKYNYLYIIPFIGSVQDPARFLLLGLYPFFWCLLDFTPGSAIPIHSEPSYDPTKRVVEALIFHCLSFELWFWIWASELQIPHLRRSILPIHLTPDTPMARERRKPPLGKAICSVLKPKFFKRLARLGHKTLQNMLKWFTFATWNNQFFFDGRQSQQRLQQLPPELHV